MAASRNKGSSSARRQRGAVTLVITLLILVAVALGIYAQVGTTSMEARMAANDKRARQAMQNAQAGIDYLLAGLQGGTLDRTYLCADAATTKAAHGFTLDFGGTACSDLPFEIITKLDRVRSWGYSADGEAVRVIESTIDLTSSWNWGASAASLPGGGGNAAIVLKGSAQVGGNADAANCNLTGGAAKDLCTTIGTSNGNQPGIVDGIVVRAGDSISTQGKAATQLDGHTTANDAALKAMSTDQLFQDYASGGMSKDEFKTKAYNYNAASGQTNYGSNQLIYVSGNMELKGNTTIGTPSKPVILFVDGNLTIKGTADIWGVVYVKSADFSVGNTKILGGLVSEGNVDMTGTAAVYHNPGLRPDASTVDPATLLANQTGKVSTIRVGSWRELSLPASAAP